MDNSTAVLQRHFLKTFQNSNNSDEMQFESKITWEKLALELELLVLEDPNSLVPLLIGLNSLFHEEDQDWSFRTINFMSYELSAMAERLEESERLRTLNEYFFKTKAFQILNLKENIGENELLIKNVLEDRQGHPLSIALIYLHFCAQLDLPIYLVNLPGHCILKWVRGGHSSYIDLMDRGHILSDDEVLKYMHKTLKSKENLNTDLLEILPSKNVLESYVNRLMKLYLDSEQFQKLLTCLNVAIKINSNKSCYLAKRALVYKSLSMFKEAYNDFKKYFSFVDMNQAPAEIKMSYFEVKALIDPSQPQSQLIH